MDELILIFRTNSRSSVSAVERVKSLLSSKDRCELHDLTHGKVAEKASWKAFRTKSSTPIQMYHQDEIPDAVRSFLLSYDPELPVVLAHRGKEYTILLSADEIKHLKGDTAVFIQRLS